MFRDVSRNWIQSVTVISMFELYFYVGHAGKPQTTVVSVSAWICISTTLHVLLIFNDKFVVNAI